MDLNSLFICFFLSLGLFLLAHCRSRVLFLRLITLSDINTPLDSSGRGIGPSQRYFSGKTDIHCPSRILNHNARNQMAVNPFLRSRVHRDFSCFLQSKIEYMTVYILLALFLQIFTITNKCLQNVYKSYTT